MVPSFIRTHTALSERFFGPHHTLYLPDLAPCDFLFPKIGSTLKRNDFESFSEVEKKMIAFEMLNERSAALL